MIVTGLNGGHDGINRILRQANRFIDGDPGNLAKLVGFKFYDDSMKVMCHSSWTSLLNPNRQAGQSQLLDTWNTIQTSARYGLESPSSSILISE